MKTWLQSLWNGENYKSKMPSEGRDKIKWINPLHDRLKVSEFKDTKYY